MLLYMPQPVVQIKDIVTGTALLEKSSRETETSHDIFYEQKSINIYLYIKPESHE